MSISNNILQRIKTSKEKQAIIFCFSITLANEKTLYLCSTNKIVTANNLAFLPQSGLSVASANFNDSGQNEIILHGIFEKNGITKELSVSNAKIDINCIIDNEFMSFASVYVVNFIKHDLEFYIKCAPETIKYNRSILNLYSKTCRAKFGDAKCNVNKDEYKKKYQLKEVGVDYLIIKDINEKTDDYTFGDVIICNINNAKTQYKILSHINNRIQIDGVLDKNLMTIDQIQDITLILGCDKSFNSCYKKYNNLINFRGEPWIPSSNFLKY